MRQLLKELILFCFITPFYWISLCIPKKRNLWIFGSWYGERYADNSKSLFEYIKRSHSEIKPIWITNNRNITTSDIIYKYSLKGILYSIIGEVNIVTHSIYNDIGYLANSNKINIQLWHGAPIKKIGFDDKVFAKRDKNSIVKRIKEFLFPFTKEKYSFIIAASDEEKAKIESAFLTKKVKITGHPRTDSLFQTTKTDNHSKTILYMPTFRDARDSNFDLFSDYGFDTSNFNKQLCLTNSHLFIKTHPVNNPSESILIQVDQCSNISILDKNIDLQDTLQNYDILISDYSSVYIDYLLTDNPIIFSPFDIEKYLTSDRELYYDYNDVTPGPKCNNWNDVLDWIVKFSADKKAYNEERVKIKNLFHKYQDGENCKRVFEEILKEKKRCESKNSHLSIS